MLTVVAFAQKGESAVGINFNISPGSSATATGFECKYQRFITDPIRVEGTLGYDFSSNTDFFEIGINAHWLYSLAPKINVYPIVGLGYVNYDYADFFFNLGVGEEYQITERLSACFEVKYQYISDFNRFPITIGIAYKF